MNYLLFIYRRVCTMMVTCLLAVLTLSYAKATPVTATASADTTEGLIGDQIRVFLQFTHPAGIQLRWPIIPDTLGGLEVLNRSDIDTVHVDGSFRQQQRLTVAAFDSGTYVIPPLPFLWQADAGKPDTAFTAALTLTYHTVPVNMDEPIKPIKAPLKLPLTWAEIWPYLLGFLVLIPVIWLLIGYIRKWLHRRKQKPRQAPPPEPPYKTARKELDKLEKAGLWQQGKVKAYYIRLTVILRRYIERQLKVRAMELTTEETMSNVQKAEVAATARSKLSNVLRTADTAKFAKAEPLPEENEACMKAARDFVELTRPQVEGADKQNGQPSDIKNRKADA